MADLVITWPKQRTLQDYLDTCNAARQNGESINFHVSNRPRNLDGTDRVFVVHDGAVRGWHWLTSVVERGDAEVWDPVTGGHWPAGFYLVRDPEWHEIAPIPMRGFQGWRYFQQAA